MYMYIYIYIYNYNSTHINDTLSVADAVIRYLNIVLEKLEYRSFLFYV